MEDALYVDASRIKQVIRRVQELEGLIAKAQQENAHDSDLIPVPLGLCKLLVAQIAQIKAESEKEFDSL